MNQRSQFLGYALAALVVLSTDPLTGVGHGQFDLGSSATVTNHSVSVGRLIRSGRSRNGTPRFALLGDEGSVTAYVVPTAGMSLGSYLNKQVGITARSMRRGPNRIPYILAQKVSNLEPIVSESRDYDEPRIISADGLDELTEVMQDFQEEDEDSSLADLLWRDLDDEVVLAQAQETVTTPMPMTMTPTPGYTGDFAIEDGTYYPGVSDYPSMSAQGGIGMPMGAGCGDPTCTTCGPPRPARWWFRAGIPCLVDQGYEDSSTHHNQS